MKKIGYIISGIAIIVMAIYLIVPKPKLLEKYSFSTAIYDTNNKLLKINLSLDDKYRLFVPYEEVPENLKKSLLLYEDKSFFHHFGVNPLSLMRAGFAISAGKRIQGASTITMQLARIIYNIDSRKISGKIIQIMRAIQIEIFYSKEEILEAYFNVAPYGGNIEGIGAASIIYFNTRAQNLNLQQAMAMAVIPQNPTKRNLAKKEGYENVNMAMSRLQKIWQKKYGHGEDQWLNLPLYANKHLPSHALHFVREVGSRQFGEIFTTLDLNYQLMLEKIISTYIEQNKEKGIYNAAAMIVNHKTMEVIAYVGSADFYNEKIQGQVDAIKSLRSPGSALKPFIFALGIDEGKIHPMSIMRDIPKNYGFYTPENFERNFMGLVNATDALILSRNIPAIELLQKLEKNSFYNLLQNSGVQKMKRPEHYGLALALGGFEVTMQDTAKLYAMLANFGKLCELKTLKNQPQCEPIETISPEAAYLTMDMLKQNHHVDRSKSIFIRNKDDYNVYWKTGTSYGFRDAVTAGIAGDYVIVVWIGNFDNSSNHNFIGRRAAAPLFFNIVRSLSKVDNLYDNYNIDNLNITKVDICKTTGDIANEYCREIVKSYFIPGVSSIKVSNITRMIPINIETGKRACFHKPPYTKLEIYDFWPSNVLKTFELAGMALKRPPEFEADCEMIETFERGNKPTIHYPTNDSIYLVRSHNLENEKIILKATTDSDTNQIYWFLDSRLIGKSSPEETLDMPAEIGRHTITATDNLGRSSSVNIEINLAD